MTVGIPKQVGRYVVLGELGHGARSRILQVQHEDTNEFYTLKQVIWESPDDDRFFEQAENEYSISRHFTHTYLRKSFQIKKIRKWLKVTQLYVLMEYFAGQTLKQHRPTDIDQIINIFLKVADGLDAMHQMGYAHTDIKPKNILVGNNGTLKIIDFGQCCSIGSSKHRIQGTPDFMAPEQVRRGIMNQRTDVFNLGASLYWVLVDQNFPTTMPKPTGNEIALASSKDPQTPEEANPDVPTPLSKLVMDCCQSRPTARPEDMREVIARLEVARHILKKREPKAAPASAEPVEPDSSGEFPPLEDLDDSGSDEGDIESWLEL